MAGRTVEDEKMGTYHYGEPVHIYRCARSGNMFEGPAGLTMGPGGYGCEHLGTREPLVAFEPSKRFDAIAEDKELPESHELRVLAKAHRERIAADEAKAGAKAGG